MFDPEQMIVRNDDGRILTPAEVLEGWGQLGAVEPLPVGVDPNAVMRDFWQPSTAQPGGNIGAAPFPAR